MARLAVLITLCFVATSHGFGFPFAKSYASRLFRPETNFVGVSGLQCPRGDGLFQNSEDCSSYFQCFSGRVWLRRCPANLHFSAETQRCEFPCDARCDRSLAEECSWDKLTQEEALCQMPFDKGPCHRNLKRYFYDDQSGSCKKFQYGGCKGNQNNFHTKEDCERACKNVRAPQQNDLLLFLSFLCFQNNENYTNPSDCGSYFMCANGVAEVVPCGRDQHYNVLENKCTSPCEAVCDKSLACQCNWPSCVSKDFAHIRPSLGASVSMCKAGGGGLYPIPGDCFRYTLCLDGVATVLFCPVGQHFSPKSRKCMDRCGAHCDESLAKECE